MPLSSLLAAAAVLAEPTLSFTPDDYPREALRDEDSAAAIVDVFIDPNGRIVRCKEVKAFGEERLAAKFCSILKLNRHKAATDSDGTPAFGWVLGMQKMFIPDTKQGDEIAAMSWKPRVSLPMEAFPAGAQDGPVKLAFEIDATGQQTACGPGDGEPRVEAVQIACNTLRAKFSVKTDKDDQPVSYVTSLYVDFTLKPEGPAPR